MSTRDEYATLVSPTIMEAGPSQPSANKGAPEHPLPATPFYSIEYPGYVQPASVPAAIRNMGGQSSLDNAFKRTASKHDGLVELNLRPENPFSHPIPGDLASTSNILLKVVKRKRRKLISDDSAGDEMMGEYTVEALGVIPKTVRFRSMADYQYQPDSEDPITQLRQAMDNMDVEAIRNFRIPPEKEDYQVAMDADSMQIDPQLTEGPEEGPDIKTRSNLRLFPPPLFSRQAVPLNYNFKANPMSTVTTVIDANGEEKKRLINKSRWKGYGPASIVFTDQNVPDKPPALVEETRERVDKRLLKLLKERFDERPVWTRAALFNQFTPAEARDIHNSKVLLPLVGYSFGDGPWRDTLIRFSYDPRQDPNARFYQRLYFRNINHPIARPSVVSRRQESRINTGRRALVDNQEQAVEGESRQSHVFDGVTMSKETAAFQLCDIIDPMLKDMIEDDEALRDVCNERDGWYTTHAFEQIKTVLRHKFFCLLEGHIATDEECTALLSTDPAALKPATTNRKLRYGKHNMAKGALPPEDVAAARLRATLERNAKTLQEQRSEAT
ncbi:hypothetical protein JAAARDRAFT_234891 [Jaapia argillacea MUCL 33604]|uniref:Transcription factor IIIC subunit 5 HTH domain-containing protein n=1 Tax=Jaapia argillacea MUCL 33604 TaxID=933084 RepID=A0A067QPW1_9AGAM|nr:hypothetical protein JAAARDRAFT_234891 [Jaapia argillacea MUCL 33604]